MNFSKSLIYNLKNRFFLDLLTIIVLIYVLNNSLSRYSAIILIIRLYRIFQYWLFLFNLFLNLLKKNSLPHFL